MNENLKCPECGAELICWLCSETNNDCKCGEGGFEYSHYCCNCGYSYED